MYVLQIQKGIVKPGQYLHDSAQHQHKDSHILFPGVIILFQSPVASFTVVWGTKGNTESQNSQSSFWKNTIFQMNHLKYATCQILIGSSLMRSPFPSLIQGIKAWLIAVNLFWGSPAIVLTQCKSERQHFNRSLIYMQAAKPFVLIKTVWDRLEEWTWHVSHTATPGDWR